LLITLKKNLAIKTFNSSALSISFILLLIFGCNNYKYTYDENKKHHGKKSFQNNYPHPEKKSFLKWQIEKFKNPDNYELKETKTEFIFPNINSIINSNNDLICWLGHSTFLLKINNKIIITDPHLTSRASPFTFIGPKRKIPNLVSFSNLPQIDVTLISHNHYDHLDITTIKEIYKKNSKTFTLAGLGHKHILNFLSSNSLIELDWWENFEYQNLSFTFVPVQHWSSRVIVDRNKSLWGGWVIEYENKKIFFAGDLGFSKDIIDIKEKFGEFHLAFIPIGAYAPRWFMKTMHVNPFEAVKIHKIIAPKKSIAMHWGTFKLTDEPLNEPPVKLRETLLSENIPLDTFLILKPGQIIDID